MRFVEFLTEGGSVIQGVDGETKQYYENAVKFLRNKLGVPSSTIVTVHINFKHDFGSGHNGSTLPDLNKQNVLHMFLKPGLDRATLLRAIAHEMVHVEQIANKRLNLKIEDGKLKSIDWKGKPVKALNYNRSSEWEIEAHAKEQNLMLQTIQAIGNLST